MREFNGQFVRTVQSRTNAPREIVHDACGFAWQQFMRYRLSDPAGCTMRATTVRARPGRSLRWAKVSARYMLSLREDRDRDDCDDRRGD